MKSIMHRFSFFNMRNFLYLRSMHRKRHKLACNDELFLTPFSCSFSKNLVAMKISIRCAACLVLTSCSYTMSSMNLVNGTWCEPKKWIIRLMSLIERKSSIS